MSDAAVPPTNTAPDSLDDALVLAVRYPTPRAAVLQVDGELDALTCGRFGRRALALLDDRPELIIDLSQVRFMDSSALGVLIVAHDAAQVRQGQLHVVTGDAAIVVWPVRRTALDRLLQLHPALNDALAALTPPG